MAATSSWQHMEELVDTRRRQPRFAVTAAKILPPEIVLLTEEPMQSVCDGLVKRVFVLGFLCRDGKPITHVEQHCEKASDAIQIQWALERFQSNLQAAQLV